MRKRGRALESNRSLRTRSLTVVNFADDAPDTDRGSLSSRAPRVKDRSKRPRQYSIELSARFPQSSAALRAHE